MLHGDVSVDITLAVGHVLAVRTLELRRHAALEAHVALHAVQVRVTAQAARTLVTLHHAVQPTCAQSYVSGRNLRRKTGYLLTKFKCF